MEKSVIDVYDRDRILRHTYEHDVYEGVELSDRSSQLRSRDLVRLSKDFFRFLISPFFISIWQSKGENILLSQCIALVIRPLKSPLRSH